MRDTLVRLRLKLPESRLSVGLILAAAALLSLVAMWTFNLGPAGSTAAQHGSDASVPAIADTQIGPWAVALDVAPKLIGVLALIYVLSALAKRYLLRMGPLAQGNLHVLETRTLGPKKTLHLVEVGGRVLLLGATDSAISNLAEFNDPDVIAELCGEHGKDSKLDFPQFLSLFRDAGPRTTDPDLEPTSEAPESPIAPSDIGKRSSR